ncbi:hypothetical protein ACJJTC_004873, partial [Scirpophaga incertulas]
YITLEQIILANIDCHNYISALSDVLYLHHYFPGSLRVIRHRATIYEAQEKYDEASEMLDVVIKEDETNSAPRKRKVAILKAQGLIPEAIKELVEYLKRFMSDVEAWQELSELYLVVGELPRAAFCAEELILHQPHSHLFHQRLADIRYTMGGVENMELAKTYYCQALKLNPSNLRALLGLFLATNNLLGHYKSSGNGAKRKEVWKLCQWAQSATQHLRIDETLTTAMLNLAITE